MDPAPLEAYLRGWVPGSDMDRVFEELEGLVKSQLTPRLVIDNVSQPVMIADLRPSKNEPCLLDTVNRRRLNKEWLDWCVETYGVNHSHAFEVGAKSMIDNEFAHGKMRKNVEILPWDPSDPLLVKIKYHDPMDPTDPWFEESK
jgi:hypothetical protein